MPRVLRPRVRTKIDSQRALPRLPCCTRALSACECASQQCIVRLLGNKLWQLSCQELSYSVIACKWRRVSGRRQRGEFQWSLILQHFVFQWSLILQHTRCGNSQLYINNLLHFYFFILINGRPTVILQNKNSHKDGEPTIGPHQ